MATDEETTGNETPEQEHVESEAPTTEALAPRGQNWFITLLWYIFVGSWLSAVWSLVAWLLMISVIGMPLGNWMLDRLPQIGALQSPVRTDGSERPPQVFWLLRVLYFVFIGSWLSFVWLLVAWCLSLTLIGLPLAVAMWNRTPAITTLARY